MLVSSCPPNAFSAIRDVLGNTRGGANCMGGTLASCGGNWLESRIPDRYKNTLHRVIRLGSINSHNHNIHRCTAHGTIHACT